MPQIVYEKFVQLLVKECPRLHKVNEFADLLNITPQNLNAICRKHTGKSASEIITNQLFLEAKRYILHTDNTIDEIAEILSFTDSSNFVNSLKSTRTLPQYNSGINIFSNTILKFINTTPKASIHSIVAI